MKTVVLERDVLEDEVKPRELLDEYRHLLQRDVESMLLQELKRSACPGCLEEDSSRAFMRYGMTYRCCENCGSLFVSPRPTEKVLANFYRESGAMGFWRQRILPETRDVRRSKLFRPRAQWLLDVVDEYRPKAVKALAVGYNNDLLVEELLEQEEDLFDIIVANPVADVEFAGKDLPGVQVHALMPNELATLGPVDLFMAFDILDRCADLEALVTAAYDTLAPGGLLLATTTLGSGFDVQVLWERAAGTHPPERLNLLSVEGVTALCERRGFSVVEFSTPGVFDTEEVRTAMAEQPDLQWPRFIRYLVENREDAVLESLQEFLQRFRLSSFARIVLQKPI